MSNSAWPQPPYRALDFYEASDAPIFRERDGDIKICMRQLLASETRLLLLQGSSGSGKSSFLRAGLIPRLKSLLAVRRNSAPLWNPAFLNVPNHVVRATSDPLVALADGMKQALESGEPLIFAPNPRRAETALGEAFSQAARAQTLAALEKHPILKNRNSSLPADAEGYREFADFVLSILKQLTPAHQSILFLFIDQAEEVLTRTTNARTVRPEAAAFFYFLEEICFRKLNVRVAVALRTEYYGRFRDEFRIDNETFESKHAKDRESDNVVESFLLRSMREPRRLIDAFLYPTKVKDPDTGAAPYPFRFQEGLLEKIVEDALHLPGLGDGSVMPIISLVCADLHRQLKDGAGEIVAENYPGVGNLLDSYFRRGIGYVSGPDLGDALEWEELLYDTLVSRQGGGTVVSLTEDVETFATNARLLKEGRVAFGDSSAERIPHALNILATSDAPLLREIPAGDGSRKYCLKHDAMAVVLDRRREARRGELEAQKKAREETERIERQKEAAERAQLVAERAWAEAERARAEEKRARAEAEIARAEEEKARLVAENERQIVASKLSKRRLELQWTAISAISAISILLVSLFYVIYNQHSSVRNENSSKLGLQIATVRSRNNISEWSSGLKASEALLIANLVHRYVGDLSSRYPMEVAWYEKLFSVIFEYNPNDARSVRAVDAESIESMRHILARAPIFSRNCYAADYDPETKRIACLTKTDASGEFSKTGDVKFVVEVFTPGAPSFETSEQARPPPGQPRCFIADAAKFPFLTETFAPRAVGFMATLGVVIFTNNHLIHWSESSPTSGCDADAIAVDLSDVLKPLNTAMFPAFGELSRNALIVRRPSMPPMTASHAQSHDGVPSQSLSAPSAPAQPEGPQPGIAIRLTAEDIQNLEFSQRSPFRLAPTPPLSPPPLIIEIGAANYSVALGYMAAADYRLATTETGFRCENVKNVQDPESNLPSVPASKPDEKPKQCRFRSLEFLKAGSESAVQHVPLGDADRQNLSPYAQNDAIAVVATPRPKDSSSSAMVATKGAFRHLEGNGSSKANDDEAADLTNEIVLTSIGESSSILGKMDILLNDYFGEKLQYEGKNLDREISRALRLPPPTFLFGPPFAVAHPKAEDWKAAWVGQSGLWFVKGKVKTKKPNGNEEKAAEARPAIAGELKPGVEGPLYSGLIQAGRLNFADDGAQLVEMELPRGPVKGAVRVYDVDDEWLEHLSHTDPRNVVVLACNVLTAIWSSENEVDEGRERKSDPELSPAQTKFLGLSPSDESGKYKKPCSP